jgi:hypothetical protein
MTDIVCYWDRYTRLWIVHCVDADGNQLWDAEFYLNARTLRAAWSKVWK